MTDKIAPVDPPVFRRSRGAALIVGPAAMLLSVVGAVFDPQQFLSSYLVAYIFWAGLTFGALGLLLLVFLAGGMWGLVVRRILEAAANTMPLIALLFLPLALGAGLLYPWAHGDVSGPNQEQYLNLPFWIARAVIYLAVGLGVTFATQRWSHKQDRTVDPEFQQNIRRPSGLLLVVFALAITFALVDWTMSLEPHWWSTIYPGMVAMGMVTSAFGFAIVAAATLAARAPLARVLSRQRFNDLGSLLLAFVMMWAYLAFSQYMLIYAGNLSDELPWYLRRLQGGWEWIAGILALSQFALPFALLLFRDLKRSATLLAVTAGLLVFGRWLDAFWLVSPGVNAATRPLSLHWLDLSTTLGMGGLWLAYFAWDLNRRPLLPLRDPRLMDPVDEERRLVEA